MADDNDRASEKKVEPARRVPPMPQRDAYYPPETMVKNKPSLMTVLLVMMTVGMVIVTLAVLIMGTMAGPMLLMGLGFALLLFVQYWIWGRLFEKMYRSDVAPPAEEPPPPMRERL